MRCGLSFGALALFLSLAAPGAAQAQFADDLGYYQGGGPQPLDRILPQIRANHPGRFYDAEGPFVGPDGQMHYRVKWMTPGGRVVWFDADARTGRVLSTGSGRRGYEYAPEGQPRGFGGYLVAPNERGPARGPWGGRQGGREWGGGGRNWGGGFWGRGRGRGH